MKPSFMKILIITLIILLGLSLRLNNLNWDQGFHLHPDERFLTMVGNDIDLPKSISEYLNPQTSSLNPYNNGYDFFVYGMFPVFLNKIVALIFNNNNYFDFTTQGRLLSGLADGLIILLIYKALQLFEIKYSFDKSIKYWGAFFYSITVLSIQLSHFFTVDTFLNLFVFTSFYFAFKYSLFMNNKNIYLSSFFLGLGIASKVSALLMLPLIVYLIWYKNKNLKQFFKFKLIYIIILYFTLRIFNPYLFDNSNFLNPNISKIFINNISTLKSFESFSTWYPPAIQWISKTPIIYSLYNLSFFGTGIFIFILFLYGSIIVFRLKNNSLFKALLIWLIGIFIYHSTQFVQGMRYFFLIYPFIAIFAGIGAFYLLNYFKRFSFYEVSLSFIVILALIWPLSFSQIYKKDHSRVEASKWIYKNIEANSTILTEYWDDPLPLLLENSPKDFINFQLPVFEIDTIQKWKKMNEFLDKGDYLILSSNRGWGSIISIPEKYPIMSNFYKNLFQNKLEYKKIMEISSFPTFYLSGFNIKLNDSIADESFTVYDHPKVLIFKKQKNP